MHRFRSLFVVILPIFTCALLSSQSYALELTSDVTLKTGSYQSSLDWTAPDSLCTRNGNFTVRNANADVNCTINSITLGVPDRNDYVNGDYITTELYFYNSGRNDSGDYFSRFNLQSTGSSNGAGVDLVDVRFEELSSSSAKVTLYSRVWQAGNIYSLTFGYTPNIGFTLWPGEGISAGLATVWHENNDVDYSTTLGNISSAVSSIQSAAWGINNNAYYNGQQLVTVNSNLGTINGGINDIRQLISNTSSSIDNQTKAMNDIHEDEKQTIEDNGEAAEGNFYDFNPTLSFSDPFSWMWSLGTSEDCANIPTLASLIHSSSSTYCSWWPSSIRSIVSPIVNIFVLIIIFGFAIRWLKSGGM